MAFRPGSIDPLKLVNISQRKTKQWQSKITPYYCIVQTTRNKHTYAHTHTCNTHTQTHNMQHTFTHHAAFVHTHAKQASKAYGSYAKHSYCHPVNQANPPGIGQVTCRMTLQVSWIEVAEPKAPQRPICSPSLHQVTIDVTAGWAVYWTLGHQVPI